MDIKHHSQPHMLERYSFLWSEARLVIAAVALFLGGIPPLAYLLRAPALFGLVRTSLTLAWIISGVVAVYLLYRWYQNGRHVFGGTQRVDVAAFFVSIVSGLNLGLTGLTGSNPGMSIASSYPVFIITGVVYLAAAWHLWKRWKEHGERIVG